MAWPRLATLRVPPKAELALNKFSEPVAVLAVPRLTVGVLRLVAALTVPVKLALLLMVCPLMRPEVMVPLVTLPDASTWKALAVPLVRVPDMSRLPVTLVLFCSSTVPTGLMTMYLMWW